MPLIGLNDFNKKWNDMTKSFYSILEKSALDQLNGIMDGRGYQNLQKTNYASFKPNETGWLGNSAEYSSFVEYGRGPVRAKNAKFLRFEINGRVFYRKQVRAAAPRPVFIPVARSIEGEAMQLFMFEFKKYIPGAK